MDQLREAWLKSFQHLRLEFATWAEGVTSRSDFRKYRTTVAQTTWRQNKPRAHHGMHICQTEGEKEEEILTCSIARVKPHYIPESKEVGVTRKQAVNIEKLSLSQSSSQEWHSQGRSRLTASSEFACYKKLSYVSAVAYGQKQEAKDRMIYSNLNDKHVPVFFLCGLVIDPGLPVVDRTEHPMYGLLEIRCPKSIINLTLQDTCSDTKFCCTQLNGSLHLKRNHKYHFQVQGQLYITGHPNCTSSSCPTNNCAWQWWAELSIRRGGVANLSIELTNSQYNSAITLSPKKDSIWRFYVDIRLLNRIMHNPLPPYISVKDALSSLGQPKYLPHRT
ncbi:hypothetical protein PR048_009191 [Dryococelus australis]|uniref:Uncharacterized protein n=1 Tax=Dryococelus australis TaxID=614101 RepID=A0ABQ9I0A0_9NEOP|nr:hypothetical protein PR048_009191 [Dryococelus australis]